MTTIEEVQNAIAKLTEMREATRATQEVASQDEIAAVIGDAWDFDRTGYGIIAEELSKHFSIIRKASIA